MTNVRPDGKSTPRQVSELVRAIEQIAQGDEEVFAAFYDRTKRWVHGTAHRLLGDGDAADEVTVDVYLRVWDRAGEFSLERGTPLAWLQTMARSRALDRLRSEASRVRREDLVALRFTDIEVEDAHTREGLEHADRRKVVLGALANLPEEQRVVLELAFFPGLTHDQIATRLGCPLGTIKTRIRLGMEKLRQVLAPRENEI